MESLDGTTDLRMSGARAVFTIERGADLEEEDIAAAFAEQGMKLESFERVHRPRAQARYRVDAGVT